MFLGYLGVSWCNQMVPAELLSSLLQYRFSCSVSRAPVTPVSLSVLADKTPFLRLLIVLVEDAAGRFAEVFGSEEEQELLD